MKNFKAFAVFIILLSTLFIISCDVRERKSFDSKLLGTWVTNVPSSGSSVYSGTLKIDYYTITIDGYGEEWLSLIDDSKRPFKGYPKRVQFTGYSEEGKIFIDYNGLTSIPYTYNEAGTYPNRKKLLTFNFGGRDEILECPLDY
jgi:hypothetical protein